MGQGQPRAIIWTILVVLPYTMVHTKFQGHWSIGSGEEDFLRFLPYMGMAAILVMWPGPFEQLFVPPTPGGYIWNLVTIGPVVSEEKSFKIVDGRWRRTTYDGAFPSYKLPRSLWLRWAKKQILRYSQEISGKLAATWFCRWVKTSWLLYKTMKITQKLTHYIVQYGGPWNCKNRFKLHRLHRMLSHCEKEKIKSWF